MTLPSFTCHPENIPEACGGGGVGGGRKERESGQIRTGMSVGRSLSTRGVGAARAVPSPDLHELSPGDVLGGESRGTGMPSWK